ncbi:MAG: PepSY domain-containing protein, partial [Gammaproteobacteria bacterium]
TPNNHPVALESAEFIARGPFPRAELRRVTTPAGDSGIYRINLRQGNEINFRHPYTTVWVDRWSGHIKEVRDPSGFNQGEVFTTWIWPVHTGEAFGETGRLLWFFAGIGLFVLYVSGLLRWLHRCGKVKDRRVSYAALRPLYYRVQQTIYRVALMLFRLLVLLLQRAKYYAPYVMKRGVILLQWLLSMINQQKRLGKK